jgi:hypothetical protein
MVILNEKDEPENYYELNLSLLYFQYIKSIIIVPFKLIICIYYSYTINLYNKFKINALVYFL